MNTIRVCAISIVCYFFLIVKAEAQGIDSLLYHTASINKAKKNELSLDLYNLFRSGEAMVMYRYSPQKKGAYRLSLGSSSSSNRDAFQYDTTGKLTPTRMKILDSKSAALTTRIGYEFRKVLGRHVIFGGMDLGFGYYSFNQKPITTLPYRVYNYSLNPLIGVKYQIASMLSVSLEIEGSASYNLIKTRTASNQIAAVDEFYGFAFSPLRVINISYHF